ncbi:hypothetical protein ACF08M_36865, partial [Streptomyces sp. NPDC015032]|uniref:hypothetical protein n=1 Tax=Streptomyces sp. NPDC015032 TaxID=3364937 RepID=UPI0036F9F7B6
SGEYFDVPNGNSRPMDLHDPMIRVSTIKGKRPGDLNERQWVYLGETLRDDQMTGRDLDALAELGEHYTGQAVAEAAVRAPAEVVGRTRPLLAR